MTELHDGLSRNKEELTEKLKTQPTPSMERMISKCWSSFESWCDNHGSFNPAELAWDIVRNSEGIKTDPTNDILYLYDGDTGIYDWNGDVRLRRLIDHLLHSKNRQHRTTETIYLIHSKTQTPIQFSPRIACQNGLLNVKTHALEDFTPDEFVTVKIPPRHDKNADCPTIKKFFSEILEADQIPIAQELIGYCLLREYPIHTSFVLLGEGANGKSTFLNLLNAFLGSENCSHATLQQLCEGKFELAELYGKLANICDDLPGEALKNVANFKNLTGDASIMAQFKHKKPFNFLNTAKLLWACNKLPKASEDTVAYYRRFVILSFNKYFLRSKADIKLLKKLTTPDELTGLLNYALDGLDRLLFHGQFSNAKSVEETRSQYIRTADSCQAFLEEMTEITQNIDDYVREDDLYQQYTVYCKSHRAPTQRKANLTISIQRHRPEAQRTQIRILKERPRVWQYLKLKETVTRVTTVTGIPSLSELSDIQIIEKDREAVTGVTAVTPKKTCGQCMLWHKPTCSIPNAEYTCVVPTNTHAVDCRGFIVREGS